jgi:hypothetical protein
VEWEDSQLAATLARNLERLRNTRGMTNWNQMAVAFNEWAKGRRFVNPIPVNTLRSIAKRSHSPNLARLAEIAEFLKVPVYALLVDGMPPDQVQAVETLINTFVHSDEATRQAIIALLAATSGHPRRPKVAAA